MFSQGAWAVVFNVTTAEEFQAALSAAAVNGADDEIVLAPGDYSGNFTFKSKENSELLIRGAIDEGQKVKIFDSALILQSISYGSLDEGAFNVTLKGLELIDVSLRNNLLAEERQSLSLSSLLWSNSGEEFGPLYLKGLAITGSSIEVPSFLFSSGSLEIRDSSVSGVALNFNEDVTVINSSVYLQEYSDHNARLVTIIDSKIKGGTGYLSTEGAEILRSEIELTSTAYISVGRDQSIEDSSFRLSNSDTVQQPKSLGLRFEGGLASRLERNRIHVAGRYRLYLSIIDCDDHRFSIANNDLRVATEVHCESNFPKMRLANNTIYSPPWLGPPSSDSSLKVAGENADIQLYNNIIWSEDDGGLALEGLAFNTDLRGNVYKRLIGDWDVVANDSNLSLDPKFHDPENGDYRLSADSPALDAGTNEAVTDSDATDLDGNPRIINGTVDIGAYERNTAPLHPADTNEDSIITLDEFNAYNTAWRANDTWPTPPNEIPIDYVTRAGYLLQKGGEYKNIGVGKPLTWVPVSE